MAKEKKPFTVHLQFNAYGVNVWATSKKEAMTKAVEKYSKKKLSTLLDKKNCSVNEY